LHKKKSVSNIFFFFKFLNKNGREKNNIEGNILMKKHRILIPKKKRKIVFAKYLF